MSEGERPDASREPTPGPGPAAAATPAPGAISTPALAGKDEGALPTPQSRLLRAASRRLVIAIVAAALILLIVTGLLAKLGGFLAILAISFFLSFAIEPAVNWFAAHGWRRGLATGLVFLIILVSVIALIALIVPAVINGVQQALSAFPDWIQRATDFANRHFGLDLSSEKLQESLRSSARDLASAAGNIAQGLFGIGAAIVGGIFRWFTIAFFTFYIVAEGPKLRRAICSMLPPERQQRVLWTWNTAIDMTGGYFYSRLLLAVINGTLMFGVLHLLQVPFAAPLAIFVGVVSEFIPTVGTYIAGAAPVLIALIYSPPDALWIIGWIVLYQQIENIWLSPRLTAKTMSLHPAVAFGAALIGGAIGGVLAAFLALPVAGVIQAAIQTYARRYEVVESGLTPPEPPPEEQTKRGLGERFRLGRSKEDERNEPSAVKDAKESSDRAPPEP
jgi:predicted PurR-regulated permease PerM